MNVNVNDFIDFCNQVNSRNYLGDQKFAISPEKLNELKQKSEDKNLYLGIVGEFSSGKSTLINSILHQDLLKRDILQGTTCAPTFIQYDKNFAIVVEYTDGKTISFWDNCSDTSLLKYRTSGDMQGLDFNNSAIRGFIDKYTATEEYSALLDKVTVYLNNPVLQNNLVIVDTPGINANDRHSAVTKQTLEKYCDAALILTPANASCSKVLCEFIKENLNGLEDRCLGIASKIDTVHSIREQETIKEQDRTVKFVNSRFKSELGKPLAAVLPVSAVYSQGENPNEKPITPDFAERYKNMFSDLEKTIHERLIKGREGILAKSIQESVMDAIASLQDVLEERKKDLHDGEEKLKNNQLTDMDNFIENLKPEYISKFSGLSNQDEIEDIFKKAFRYTENKLQQELYYCQTREEIKDMIHYKLSAHCKKAQDDVNSALQAIQERYSRWSKESLTDFQDKFAHEFRNLSRDFQIAPAQLNAVTAITSNLRNIDISYDDEAFGKGVGYIISGILGGAIGIGLFALIDHLFLGIDRAKEKAMEETRPALREFYNQLRNYINNTANKIKDTSFTSTLSSINNMALKYKPTIDQIIKEEKDKLSQLQFQQKCLENDLNSLYQFKLYRTDF